MDFKKEMQDSIKRFSNKYPTSSFKNRDIYADWLSQTYHFVKHSTTLLGYSLPYLKEADIKRRFEDHMKEEDRHDMIALKDLEKLGYNINQFEEYSETQAFYHSQYYRIAFEGGTSLLGYILFLEYLAVTWAKDCYEEIKDSYKGATLFLKVHAEEDPHHVVEAIKVIEKLSPKEQEAILRNLKFTEEVYGQMMAHILENADVQKQAA
ncbi:MAG: iron-containing redox enzyme family protein [Bacteriovoracaceae bacterium]